MPKKDLNTHLLDPVASLEITTRTYNNLQAVNFEFTGQVVQFTYQDLMKIPNFGLRSITEVIDALTKRHLTLGIRLESDAIYPEIDVSNIKIPNVKSINIITTPINQATSSTDATTTIGSQVSGDLVGEFITKTLAENPVSILSEEFNIDFAALAAADPTIMGHLEAAAKAVLNKRETEVIKHFEKN